MLDGAPDKESGSQLFPARVGAPRQPWCLTQLCSSFPREPNKTKLVTFFQTDLSGYLPQSVVDSFFPRSMAGFYTNLEKAVKRLYD